LGNYDAHFVAPDANGQAVTATTLPSTRLKWNFEEIGASKVMAESALIK